MNSGFRLWPLSRKKRGGRVITCNVGGRGEFGECIRGFRPSGRNLVASFDGATEEGWAVGFSEHGGFQTVRENASFAPLRLA